MIETGVLLFADDIVCYEVTGPNLSARTLGESGLRLMTAALEAAIRRDIEHQRIKLNLPEFERQRSAA